MFPAILGWLGNLGSRDQDDSASEPAAPPQQRPVVIDLTAEDDGDTAAVVATTTTTTTPSLSSLSSSDSNRTTRPGKRSRPTSTDDGDCGNKSRSECDPDSLGAGPCTWWTSDEGGDRGRCRTRPDLDELQSMVEHNCRVLSRESDSAVILSLARRYLAKPPPDDTPQATLCAWLAQQFSMDGMRLTVDDGGPVASSVAHSTSIVHRVNDRLWIGERPSPRSSSNDDVHDTMFYVLERIDNHDERRSRWTGFGEEEILASYQYGKRHATMSDEHKRIFPTRETHWMHIAGDATPGHIGFGWSVKRTGFKHTGEVWVAFVTSRPVRTERDVANIQGHDVEMYMSVLTHPEAPMVVHMGIQRGLQHAIQWIDGKTWMHGRLSIPLHSFAARAIKSMRPRVVYMMTSPVVHMGPLLERALPHHVFRSTTWSSLDQRTEPHPDPVTFRYTKKVDDDGLMLARQRTAEHERISDDKERRMLALQRVRPAPDESPIHEIRRADGIDTLQIWDPSRTQVLYEERGARYSRSGTTVSVWGRPWTGDPRAFSWLNHPNMLRHALATVNYEALAANF